MKMRESLRKLVRGFKKASNDNVVKEVVVEKENRLTPESFVQLVRNNEENSKRKCYYAIENANTLAERQAKGIEVLVKLDTIVEILDELISTEMTIDNINECNWGAWVEYAGEHQYSLVYDATNVTGPEYIRGLDEKVESLSNKLIEAYTELYEITDGVRHMPLVASYCERNLHGLLVLIERILKSNNAFDKYKKVETLKSLVNELVFESQPYVNIRKGGFKSETEYAIAKFNELVERDELNSKEKDVAMFMKEDIEMAI